MRTRRLPRPPQPSSKLEHHADLGTCDGQRRNCPRRFCMRFHDLLTRGAIASAIGALKAKWRARQNTWSFSGDRDCRSRTVPEVTGSLTSVIGPAFAPAGFRVWGAGNAPYFVLTFSNSPFLSMPERKGKLLELPLKLVVFRMTLNHRVPGSSPGAPTKPFKNLARFTV